MELEEVRLLTSDYAAELQSPKQCGASAEADASISGTNGELAYLFCLLASKCLLPVHPVRFPWRRGFSVRFLDVS